MAFRLRLPESLRDALAFAPVRPAIASGVRAAVAVVLPLGLAAILHEPLLSWTGLTGFLTSIVDKGGAYRTRAATMAWVAFGASIAVAIGSLGGTSFVASIAIALFFATALSFARVFGPGATSAGSSILVILLVGLARPVSTMVEALQRVEYGIAGGLWAMILALLLWPIRPYRPARMAVGRYVRAARAYVVDVSRLPSEPTIDASSAPLRLHRALIRQSLEEARSTLAATRRGRRGESGRGERLLVILESIDRVFVATLTLTELLESARARRPWPAAQDAIARALSDLAAILDRIAAAIESERPSEAIVFAPFELDALGSPVSARGEERASMRDATEAEYAFAADLLLRAHARADEAAAMATTLEDERPIDGLPTALDVLADADSITTRLREQLTLRSVALRHALRVGVTTASAVWLTHSFHLARGYWVTIAAAVMLQPQLPATFSRATQRVLGTVVGGILAAAIATLVHDPRAMMVVVFALAIVSVSLMPINYTLYSVFLTPTFILIAEVNTHEPGLVKARIINTLLGGVLALAGARLLWPLAERELFPNAAAAALRQVRVYVDTVSAFPPLDRLTRTQRRRDVGLALLNAEASLQRLIIEARARPSELEAPMALLVYTRGLVAAIMALGVARDPAESIDIRPFATELADALDDLADAVQNGRPPKGLPNFERSIGVVLSEAAQIPKARRALFRSRFTRVIEELAVQHDAVARWLNTPDAASLEQRE